MSRNNSPSPTTSTHAKLRKSIANFFTKKNQGSMDIPTILLDVDEILASRSIEDGRRLLRGMVEDLLKEVDLLRFRLEETEASLQRVKEERDVVNHDYRDRLYALMLALQQATGDDSLKEKFKVGDHPLTADEATQLTIKALTAKIEKLSVDHQKTADDLTAAKERMEDLESELAAKNHKVHALENQFKAINKKRFKVVSKLTDCTNNVPPNGVVTPDGTATNMKRSSRRRVVKLIEQV